MKKIKYVLFLILIVFSFNVKAANDTCDRNEILRLKEIAKKVEFDYDYKVVNRVASFSIKAVNLNKEIKVRIIEDYYKGKYREFKDDGSHTATLDDFSTGQKVPITITAYVSNKCSGEVLSKQTIKLPYYNYFYSPDRCKGNEDFKYCKLLITENIDEAKFEKEFFTYLKAKIDNQIEEEKTTSEYNDKVRYIIIGVVSFIVLILAIMIIIRNVSRIKKKNSL